MIETNLFQLRSWDIFFGYLEKQLDQKANFSFKIVDVKNWETNNYNTHTAQYLKKQRQ